MSILGELSADNSQQPDAGLIPLVDIGSPGNPVGLTAQLNMGGATGTIIFPPSPPSVCPCCNGTGTGGTGGGGGYPPPAPPMPRYTPIVINSAGGIVTLSGRTDRIGWTAL